MHLYYTACIEGVTVFIEGVTVFIEVGTVFKNFELILLVIAGILLFISVILISITIRLAVYSKRFVIRTMQLVGAKSSFIRRPFLFRAVFNGFVSGLLAIIILVGLWKVFANNSHDVSTHS